MMKIKCVILCMIVSLLCAHSAMGEAGLSEILNSRSLWIKKPYALIWSGDHDIGHFSVDLCRAESVPIWRPLDWYFSYDGLTPTEHLVSEITGYTQERGFILMRLDPNWGREGAYAVLVISDGSVMNLSTLVQLHGFLTLQGLSFEDLHFSTFESEYRKQRIISIVHSVAAISALLTIVAAFLVRRRRRKESQPSLPGDVLKAAPEA